MLARRRGNLWHLVGTGVVLMLASWVADSYLDGVVFEEGGFLQQLLHVQPQEMAYRFQTVFFLLVFMAYAWRKSKYLERITSSLEEALTDLAIEKSRTESILASVPDAVSVQDTELRILYQNPAMKGIMGDHVGEYCYSAYHQREAVCPDCNLCESFADGLPHRREASRPGPQGDTVFVEIDAASLKDASGRVVAGIESVRDISQRKKSEEEIRKLNDSLRQQALDLQVANRELEAFSYSLSHDLRGPLTCIYIAEQALADMYCDKLDDTGRSLLQGIHSGCENMEQLINAMLVLSRVTRAELSYEEVNLSAQSAEIVAKLGLCHRNNSVQWRLAEEMVAWCDPHLAHILLENLIGNAWKYASRKDQPCIEIGQRESEGVVEFFVRDNGVGFDMTHAKRIFKPFQRLHRTCDFPGTGIGLATVQRIIDRHGGVVRAEGEVGKGAAFYFSLPMPLHKLHKH